MWISVGLEVLRQSFLVRLRRTVVVEEENSCTVGPEHNWVIFGMMLGNRWKGKLRGGLLLNTHTHTHTHIYTHTIPGAQVGVLNTISVVSFGLLPHTARNSTLPTKLFTPPFPSFHALVCFNPIQTFSSASGPPYLKSFVLPYTPLSFW